MKTATHFASAFQWSRKERVGWRTIVVAAIGMAVPALAGLAAGQLAIGFNIGLGAMLFTSGPAEEGAEQPSQLSAVAPALLAVAAATLTAGEPWSGAVAIALAAVAAMTSGYSRPVAVGAIRFIVYLMLCASLLESAGAHRGGAALLFGAGALWNMAIRAMLGGRRVPAPAPPGARPQPTPTQRRAYFRRTLNTLAGWQFPIRIAAGLALAKAVRLLWPSHHFGWVVLTVALLTQRPLEHFPVKITQRALGTLAGVTATWAVLAAQPSPLGLALLVCLAAIVAPFARAGNYLVWSAITSPVILMVMDIGRPVAPEMLTDRLAATLIGAGIVLLGNFLMARWTGYRAHRAPG